MGPFLRSKAACTAGVALLLTLDGPVRAESMATARVDEPPQLQLRWVAPEGCPAPADVEARIARLLAAPIASLLSSSLKVTAFVVVGADGYEMSLGLRDADAQRLRELGAPTCNELADATALIVALAIDPDLLSRRPDLVPPDGNCPVCPAPPPLPVPPPVVPAAPVAPPIVGGDTPTVPESDCRPRTPDTWWVVGLGANLSLGVLPKPSPGMGLVAAIERRHLRADLTLSHHTILWNLRADARGVL